MQKTGFYNSMLKAIDLLIVVCFVAERRTQPQPRQQGLPVLHSRSGC